MLDDVRNPLSWTYGRARCSAREDMGSFLAYLYASQHITAVTDFTQGDDTYKVLFVL